MQNQHALLLKGSLRIVNLDKVLCLKPVVVWAGLSGLGNTKFVTLPKGVDIKLETYRGAKFEIRRDRLRRKQSGEYRMAASTRLGACPILLKLRIESPPGAKKTREGCEDNLRGFWKKNVWLSNYPDLKPIDFVVWGTLEQKVSVTKHKYLESLKRTVEKS